MRAVRGNLLKKYVTPHRSGKAYKAIYNAILAGEYAPGTQLTERFIAEELGLSRTPVRHALARLASQGLVEEIPHVGVFVRKLEPDDVVELLELRRVLEAGAARMAALKMTPAQSEAVLKLARKTERLENAKDYVATRETEIRFHNLICTIAANGELAGVSDNVRVIFFSLCPKTVWLDIFPAGKGVGPNHVSVAEALACGDGRKAYDAMWDHIEDGINRFQASREAPDLAASFL